MISMIKISIKNKKAALQSEKLITIVIVTLVFIGILVWLFMFNGLSTLKNMFIEFGTGSNTPLMPAGDLSSQPLELRGDNPCIDVDFYWADAKGNNINGQTVEPGLVYVAIKFKDDIGDLSDAKNPKYFCRTYSLVTKDIRNDVSIPTFFSEIQKKYKPQKIGSKNYYLVDRIVEDVGWRKSGEYTFDIYQNYPDKTSRVRRGFPLHAEHNVPGIPWV